MKKLAIEVNGDWPDCEGKVLDELICVAMYHEGKLAERANVNYLKFAGQWHRLYFDCGIIFWRRDKLGPVEFDPPDTNCYFRNRNVGAELGLNGQVIRSVNARAFESGSEVCFQFTGDKKIVFFDQNDVSDYKV